MFDPSETLLLSQGGVLMAAVLVFLLGAALPVLLRARRRDREFVRTALDAQRDLERFQFANSPMALVEWGPAMQVRRWSRQAEVIFGWTSEEVVGRTMRQIGFLDEEGADQHERIMADVRAGRRDTVESLRKCNRKDGSSAWCRWYSRAMRAPDGSLLYFFSAGIDVTELRQANERLHENQAHLRAIFEQASVGIALLDESGRWLDFNDRISEITGYSRDELLTIDFQAITHPDDLAADIELAQQVAKGERRTYSLEKRYFHKEGHVVWVQLNVGRMDETELTPMRFVAVVDDITPRKRVEEEAQEHRRIRQFHTQNTPLAVIEWTPDFRVTSWSASAERMFGWKADEVVGMHPREFGLVAPGDWEPFSNQHQAAGGQDRGLPLRGSRKDGRLIWCQWYSSILEGDDGAARSVHSLVDDVTAKYLATQQLEESQAQFRSIFEQAAVGIVLIDVQGRWLRVNRRFCEIVGHSVEDLLRTTCLGITHEDDRTQERKLRGQLLAGEIADYRFEKRYVRADGTPVWVSVFARTLEQKPGEPASLALVVEDITERRESAQRLQQLHADLERKVVERTQQLQETTRRWADRTRDLSLLADMMGALPAAVDIAEASQIVAGFLPQIFGGFAGEIWIEQGVRGVYERVAGWRLQKEGPPTLRAEDCWALRRGQPLHIEDPNDPLICRHTDDERGRQGPHACMPILALGEMIGMIHLRWTELSGMSPDQALLESTAKQIGLAIGNVRLREELSRQALRDPLTGLFNRRQFESLLQRRIVSASREPGGFGILMIDVDHFKSVNDRYGHEAGDAVLKTVAEAVAQTIRPQDDVCRIGGEEFVVLLSDPAPHEIQFVAERIRARIEDLPMAFNGTALPGVTVSIGVAIFPLDASEGSTLLRVADEAMYGAKRAGRNRVCVSPRAKHARVVAIRD